MVIGARPVSTAKQLVPRPLLKWLMLHTRWPHGVRTRPEIDQEMGGTQPTDFASDRDRLLEALGRFCTAPDAARTTHPMAGHLTRNEWLRWGYLHADHHLRQFGL